MRKARVKVIFIDNPEEHVKHQIKILNNCSTC